MIKLRLYVLDPNSTCNIMSFPVHIIRKHVISVCPSIDDINLDHFIKLARTLHSKITVSPLESVICG